MQPARKIAFFLPNMDGGGAERVQLAIMRHLQDAGHEVDLLLAFDRGVLLPLVPPGVRIIPLEAKRLAGTFPGLVRYLRTERPWSLQAIMWPCTVIAVAARMAARVPTKLVLSDHTFLSEQYPGGWSRRVLRTSMALFYRRAEHRIAISDRAASDLARLAKLAPTDVEVILNPIDLPTTIQESDEAKAAWGEASPRILAVGALKEVKNHQLLLKAFARVAKELPSARLVLVGEGALRAELEELREELGLRNRIVFTGFQLDPWPYLAGADLFVLSSNYEGLPLVLAEAMHAGLRIVSTDCVTGPAEMLDHGHYGRLVPVGDEQALARAMIDELKTAADPNRQNARAREIVGPANLRRYEHLLAG